MPYDRFALRWRLLPRFRRFRRVAWWYALSGILYADVLLIY